LCAKEHLIGIIASVALLATGTPAAGAEGGGAKIYTLSDIVSLAEAKNPSLAVFQANIEAARGALTAARAFPNPEVGVDIGRARPRDTPDAGYEREWSGEVSQALEWPGTRRSSRRAAAAQVEVARSESDDFRLDLVARVKEAFFQVLVAQRALTVANRNLETTGRLVESTALRVEAGEAPELDLIKAKVEQLNVAKDTRRAESRVALAKSELNALLGGALAEPFDLEGDTTGRPSSYELAPLIERALERHPRIRRQEQAVEAARATLDRERQARIPDLTVRGGASEELDKRSSSIGLALSVPLFSQRQGEIAAARSDQARAEADLLNAHLDVTRMITQEYEHYRAAIDQLEVFEAGLLQQAEDALQIAQFSYEQGELDLLNLLDAQRVQRVTLLEYYEVQLAVHTALARLERVTGGLP
jgi:cobalt-zinc-cadmium efflux system outer membrane protein